MQDTVYRKDKLTCSLDGVSHSIFAYRDVPDPLKMYLGKDCMERFNQAYWRWAKAVVCNIFTATNDRELTNLLNRDHEAPKILISALKSLALRIER